MLVTVMKRAPECSCKLIPKFTGPFLVTARCNDNKFKILDLANNVPQVVYADRLIKVSASFSLAAVPSSTFSITDSPPSDARSSPTSYWFKGLNVTNE